MLPVIPAQYGYMGCEANVLETGTGVMGMPPNGLRISRRERAAQEGIKKGTISRAKRSDCMRVLGRAVCGVQRSYQSAF
jgi:hypothetical protein